MNSFRMMLKLILLAPILITQVLWIRYTTPRLSEAMGERQGSLTNKKRRIRLLVIGDSAAAGVGAKFQSQALTGQIIKMLSEDFSIDWKLIAWTGCKTAEMTEYIDGQARQKYDFVITSLGVNDVTSTLSCRQWLQNQQALFCLIREKYSPATIIVTAVPPMENFPALTQPLRGILGKRAESFNRQLANLLVSEDRCLLLPLSVEAAHFAADGFHPGEAGYQLWGAAVAQLIGAQLASDNKLAVNSMVSE